MTDKRYVLTDFDTELEMLELLNTQAEVISDLSEQNEELKIKFNNCNTSYWKLNDENKELKNKINTYKSANKLQQETIRLLREDNGLINITNVELFKLEDEDD